MYYIRKNILRFFTILSLICFAYIYMQSFKPLKTTPLTPQSFDFKLFNVSWFEYDVNGDLSQSFFAPEIKKSAYLDEHEVTSPLLKLNKEHNAWEIKANFAKTKKGLETIVLNDNVEIKILNTDNKQTSVLNTTSLTYHPKTQIAHTKAAVDFKNGNNLIHSQGMKADLANKKTLHLGHVTGQVLPEDHSKTNA